MKRRLPAALLALVVTIASLFTQPVPEVAAAMNVGTTTLVKPLIVGLMDRGVDDPSQAWTAPTSAYLGSVITGYAVDIGWGELQPTQNGSIASNTRLDRALSQVRSFNRQHPSTPLHLRLRVFSGVNTPAWAMNLDGPPLTLRCDNIPVPYRCSTPGPHTVQVPRFWGTKYGAAYHQFITKLSSKYDAVPEITEVDVSRCSTLYPEPLIKEFYLPGNAQAYVTAGWTQQKDVACQRADLGDFVTAWSTTSVGIALNDYETLNASGTNSASDLSTTFMLMQYCRQLLGSRCVLENNSTRTPTIYTAYQELYTHMVELGEPLAYQTATDQRVGDLNATLCTDVSKRGAMDIELPRGYDEPSDQYGVYRTPSQLLPYTRAMQQRSATCP